MNLQDLNELDLENIASWPRPAKVVFIALTCCLIAVGGYYYLLADTIKRLEAEQHREVELKNQFEVKAQLAGNLQAYRDQMKELELRLEAQLRQLPNKNEVAGLLDDISFIAADNGLKLRRINWEPEVQKEFSTELPMRIEVQGGYQELGQFAAAVAALPRIVILDSFNIQREGDGGIKMAMLAKTYRYNEKQTEGTPEGKGR